MWVNFCKIHHTLPHSGKALLSDALSAKYLKLNQSIITYDFFTLVFLYIGVMNDYVGEVSN